MNQRIFENLVRLLVFTLFLVLTVSMSYYCYVNLVKGWVAPGAVQQFANSVLAASLSLLVVLILKFTAGDIEVDALKFKFKGASTPIIFWILCFLATTYGIASLAPQS